MLAASSATVTAGCADATDAAISAATGNVIASCTAAGLMGGCSHPTYATLLAAQCPVTCNACADAPTDSPTNTPTEIATADPTAAPTQLCIDVSDVTVSSATSGLVASCTASADVGGCSNPTYAELMNMYCPVTCNTCPSSASTDPPTLAPTPAPTPPQSFTSVEVASWAAARDYVHSMPDSDSVNLTFASSFDCDYNYQMNPLGAVTVNGNGAVCDAKQRGRFFWLQGVAEFTLNSITLKNGKEGIVSEIRERSSKVIAFI